MTEGIFELDHFRDQSTPFFVKNNECINVQLHDFAGFTLKFHLDKNLV
jgi:hypothetical protein